MKIKNFFETQLQEILFKLSDGLILDLSNGYKIALIKDNLCYIHMDKFEDEDIIFPLKEIYISELNKKIQNLKFEFINPI